MFSLIFKNVQKNYGKFTALKCVSFYVKKGEFFALLGPNGAGKTTLINCLSGIVKLSGGSILVQGKDPEEVPEFTKMKLGVVEQELVFDPFFTPFETLKWRRGFFGLKPNDEYLLWILEKLSLTEKKDVNSRRLSGGMKRRLMIAKALAHEPEILILDEPTAGVDIELRQNLWHFMEELQREKDLTILLTTHYLEEAEQLADRIAILNNGEIIVCEEKKKLLEHHKRILEVEDHEGGWKRFDIDPQKGLAEFEGIICNAKNLKIREPKLEEVFLEITKK